MMITRTSLYALNTQFAHRPTLKRKSAVVIFLRQRRYISRSSTGVRHVAIPFCVSFNGSSVSVLTRLGARRPRFDSRQRRILFSLQRPDCLCGSLTLLPCGFRGSFLGINRPGPGANRCFPSGAEAKNVWSYSICHHAKISREIFTLRTYYLLST
jgi:hypothetical protein